MAGKKTELGATGETVSTNVSRLRDYEGMSYAELSRQLAAVGQPIPELGLRRIEKGERKVDVDELVALAFVLKTTPAYLLMPNVPDGHATVAMTGAGEHPAADIWEWLMNRRHAIEKSEDRGELWEGLMRTRPSWQLSALLDELRDL